jgi:hypothetical protein
MHEYQVTIVENGEQRCLTVEAATAAQARAAVEDSTDAEILAIKFTRALGFSCRQRG